MANPKDMVMFNSTASRPVMNSWKLGRGALNQGSGCGGFEIISKKTKTPATE